MGANFIYEPVVHLQTTPASVWTVEHNFGREVNPIVYVLGEATGDDYFEVDAAIEKVDNNSFTVSFYEAGIASNQVGKVIVS